MFARSSSRCFSLLFEHPVSSVYERPSRAGNSTKTTRRVGVLARTRPPLTFTPATNGGRVRPPYGVELRAAKPRPQRRKAAKPQRKAKEILYSFFAIAASPRWNANHQNLLAPRRICRVGVLAHHCPLSMRTTVGEYAHPTLGCGRSPPCGLGVLRQQMHDRRTINDRFL
jgi:hypothetical protein